MGNQLTSTGRCRWRCRVGMEVAVRPSREVWERSRASGAAGRNFLSPLVQNGMARGAGSCQSYPCKASGEPEVGERRSLSLWGSMGPMGRRPAHFRRWNKQNSAKPQRLSAVAGLRAPRRTHSFFLQSIRQKVGLRGNRIATGNFEATCADCENEDQLPGMSPPSCVIVSVESGHDLTSPSSPTCWGPSTARETCSSTPMAPTSSRPSATA